MFVANYRRIVLLCCVCIFSISNVLSDCTPNEIERELQLEEELASTKLLLGNAIEELQTLERNSLDWTDRILLQVKSHFLQSDGEPAPSPDPSSSYCVNEEHLRLVNGSSEHEGRVEVKQGDQWMKVCEDRWTQKSAQLICTMLGYPGLDVVALGGRVFGSGSNPVLPVTGTCTSAAGVICYGYENYPVRLVNGSNAHEGRVELQIAGQWGTLCGDAGWNTNEARVVCRMLGYTSGYALATGGAMFGQGTGPTWARNIGCTGSERHLLSCDGRFGARSTCSHSTDAGVVCDHFFDYPVRLVDGNAPNEGRVEIKIDSQWTPVYDSGWSNNEAAVVCRQLGYNGEGAQAKFNSYFGGSTVRAQIGYLNCDGTEHHLMACPMNYPLKYTNWNAQNDAAGVICPV